MKTFFSTSCLALFLTLSVIACADLESSDDLSEVGAEPGSIRCGQPDTPLYECLDLQQAFEFNGRLPFCKGYSGNEDLPGKEPWSSSFPGVTNDARNQCEVGVSGSAEQCRTTCGDKGNGRGGGYTSGCGWAYSSSAGRYVGRCWTQYGQLPPNPTAL